MHTWTENFYELAWKKDLSDRMLVLVQCMTKDKATGKMSPIGYLIQDLCNPTDGKIKFGTYTAQLLTPPISFRDLEVNQSPRTLAQVNFSLLAPETDRENTSQFIPNSEKQYSATDFWKAS